GREQLLQKHRSNHYNIVETEMTWDDAKSNCEVQSSNLAIIPDNKTNSEISQLLENFTEVWIGLSKTRSWYWLTTGTTKAYTLMNWQSGRPNDLDGWESCGAVVVKDGTWTDEQCDVAYPFFCIGGRNQ
uniref:C-type lectin domain-containing protein n=1 Tax=Seriola dumerili TaxID=41447 RepID=A0A3B4UBB1_SERDU